ncbi:glycosyl transferase family 2 [bacterium]|nr:glycosyl transferase family 2 [bacterium]
MARLTNNHKVVAVLPAYNAAKTLRQTVNDIPGDWVDEVILVDDASQDDTVEVARELGLIVFVHPENRGYGGNQKTCYKQALQRGADVVVMVHPDHQYDPANVPAVVEPLINGLAEAAFGSRMINRQRALMGGMPRWKYVANIGLTKLENTCLGLSLTEYHSGFRAYSRRALQAIPYEINSDNFVFDTEIIIQLKVLEMKITEVPIETRYFKDASSIGVGASLNYGLGILGALSRHLVTKWKIKKH